MIRFRERSRAGDEAGATEVSTSEPAAHHSPGLQAALSGLAGDHPGRVLDLGPSVAANVTFYSRFARHIQIVDLLGELRSEADGADAPSTVEAVLSRSLPGGVAPFDLVLLWDIINYVERADAVTLIARIHAACRSNARLLLMIFIGDEMPVEPQTFQIEAEDRISYRPMAPEMRAPTPLQPAEVERLLAGFRIESSFILRHGVREFVAVRR